MMEGLQRLLWDVVTNLHSYADRFDPRQPPAAESTAEMLAQARRTIDSITQLVVDYGQRRIGSGDVQLPTSFGEELQQAEKIVEGLRIAWSSHRTQRGLDLIIQEGQRA